MYVPRTIISLSRRDVPVTFPGHMCRQDDQRTGAGRIRGMDAVDNGGNRPE
jgi:hypothetical protein